jgi:predicted permease
VAFSIAPAWRAWRQDLLPSLKRGEHGIVSGRSKLASALMVAQLALCVVLLTGGGLAWRSLSLIDATDLGFSRDHLLLANVGGADGADLERLRQNLRAVPGVESVSWAIAAPPASHSWLAIAAQSAAGGPSIPTDGTYAGPDYLQTLGVPFLEGTEGAVIVNRKLAQALWPNQSAVGRAFLLGANTNPLPVSGVVPDAAFNGVGEDGSFSGLAKSERRPFVFIADTRTISANQDRTFHIRYRAPLADLVPAVRAAIHRTDPRLTVFSVRTMQAEWERFTAPISVLVNLVACFAIGGLFVASVGLYAVVAFYTGKRTRELGIRAALGASPTQAARLIVKEGLLLTACGLTAGLAICGFAGRAFAHLLFGVTPMDTTTCIAVIALLTAVSLGVRWLPARRAARVDPMLALRQE